MKNLACTIWSSALLILLHKSFLLTPLFPQTVFPCNSKNFSAFVNVSNHLSMLNYLSQFSHFFSSINYYWFINALIVVLCKLISRSLLKYFSKYRFSNMNLWEYKFWFQLIGMNTWLACWDHLLKNWKGKSQQLKRRGKDLQRRSKQSSVDEEFSALWWNFSFQI